MTVLFILHHLLGGEINLYFCPVTLKLWYDKPAEEWGKVLPVGNGRIGGMIV